MHKTAEEATAFIQTLRPHLAPLKRRVFLAPPFTAIQAAVKAAAGSGISIGAQNVHDHDQGAFTGEISSSMLKAMGAEFVIVGHSERRHLFAETNSFINRKVHRLLQEGLTPLICVGELLNEREKGSHEQVLKTQLEACLEGLDASQILKCIIAYEPVWAIGTGKTATPSIAQSMHRLIRSFLEGKFGLDSASKISLLYGGSVNAETIASLMEQTDIDGVLVGGASLEPASFLKLINF
jgi:triosephosphate isomerase